MAFNCYVENKVRGKKDLDLQFQVGILNTGKSTFTEFKILSRPGVKGRKTMVTGDLRPAGPCRIFKMGALHYRVVGQMQTRRRAKEQLLIGHNTLDLILEEVLEDVRLSKLLDGLAAAGCMDSLDDSALWALLGHDQ